MKWILIGSPVNKISFPSIPYNASKEKEGSKEEKDCQKEEEAVNLSSLQATFA